MDESFEFEFTLSGGTEVWFAAESKIWLYNKDDEEHPIKLDPIDLEAIIAVYNRVYEVAKNYE